MTETVLITGGTSGIGRAIARGFRSEGYEVWVTGLTESEMLDARNEGYAERVEPLDLSQEESLNTLFSKLKHLKHLVNCAGIILRNGAEFTEEGFRRVVEVNLNGTMSVCSKARPLLASQGGSIVNLASMLSFFGSGFVPGYSASKGGIVQLTKSLAIAWADQGIRVNAVAPGWIRTPLTQALQDSEERSRVILDRTPMKRWGEPEDLIGPVLFLCSEQARFITGAVLPVDGGYSIA